MHMRLAISVAALASVESARRTVKQTADEFEMLNDGGLVLDQDVEADVQQNRPFDARFENQTHQAKMSQIWRKVTAVQETAPLPSVWRAALSSLSMMVLNDFFDQRNDEKPRGQSKVIHAQGVACQFNMRVFRSSPFTGIFAPGRTTGLMRMGPPAPDMVRSGVSLKWFRSYVESANTVMASLESSENFFEHPISNHIHLFESAPLRLVRRIADLTMCSAATSLAELARYDQDGNSAGDNLNFPYELQLEPANTRLAALPRGLNYSTQIFNLLSGIPVGTKLFNVRVQAEPGAAFRTIGEFRLASQCAPSSYADTRLRFQHRRIEDDLAIRPEWEAAIREECDQHR